jgi:LysR family transcriptional regulator, glycine cleavage system transcriptional activator
MARRIDMPPLKALQSFEAAARHLSFGDAASELNVTPSAVSHQVRSLEKWLGVPVFVRSSRPIQLTREGALFSKQIEASFDGIVKAAKVIRKNQKLSKTVIATMDSFATVWLLPRLRQLPPDMHEVHIETNDAFVDFERTSVDVAVRYGNGNWPGLLVNKLFDDFLITVCSPETEVGKLTDIGSHVLLHDSGTIGWDAWLKAASLTADMDIAPGLFFSRSHFAIQAAVAGQGIALASLPLVVDHLINGRLRVPFSTTLQGPGAYYLLQRSAGEIDAHVRELVAWIFAKKDECLIALRESGFRLKD